MVVVVVVVVLVVVVVVVVDVVVVVVVVLPESVNLPNLFYRIEQNLVKDSFKMSNLSV